ncbi:Putative Competence protein ComGF [Seinonella peptonophila]|uniref:Putative Competence protein ComGF n=2 Tax=Seinonella peptonophila TaxID=112248 RepID=A0A1M4V3Z6_9BACL|nr:Putative Competence protein ComGF [Seinonella peptonophila]
MKEGNQGFTYLEFVLSIGLTTLLIPILFMLLFIFCKEAQQESITQRQQMQGDRFRMQIQQEIPFGSLFSSARNECQFMNDQGIFVRYMLKKDQLIRQVYQNSSGWRGHMVMLPTIQKLSLRCDDQEFRLKVTLVGLKEPLSILLQTDSKRDD